MKEGHHGFRREVDNLLEDVPGISVRPQYLPQLCGSLARDLHLDCRQADRGSDDEIRVVNAAVGSHRGAQEPLTALTIGG